MRDAPPAVMRARRSRRAAARRLREWEIHAETSYLGDKPRHTLLGALHKSTGGVVEFEASVSKAWEYDIGREWARLRQCEEGKVCLFDESRSRFIAGPMYCGSRMCPVCGRIRAARYAAKWRPVFEAAMADGRAVKLLTLTQPNEAIPGGAVTPSELRRWAGGERLHGRAAQRPVGGENILDAYGRFRSAFRALRRNRATRALVGGCLGGYVQGLEWTARGRGGVPRWHCHGHILAIEGDNPDWGKLVDAWCGLAHAEPHAQDVRPGDAGSIAEALKYPYKLSEMTGAQMLSVWAHMRGQRPHQAGGALYHSSKASKEHPWAMWLAAKGQPEPHRRVMWLDESVGGDGEWRELTSGSWPEGRRARWGVTTDTPGVLSTWDGPVDRLKAIVMGEDYDPVDESMKASWVSSSVLAESVAAAFQASSCDSSSCA